MSTGHEKLQIGRAGELLVQARLLLRGIDSAPMTTDRGIDLIASRTGADGKVMSVSIQVKTTAQLYDLGKPGECYYWKFPSQSPAAFFAFVAANENKRDAPSPIWLFDAATLNPKLKNSWFTIYTRDAPRRKWTIANCKPHLLENMVGKLFCRS